MASTSKKQPVASTSAVPEPPGEVPVESDDEEQSEYSSDASVRETFTELDLQRSTRATEPVDEIARSFIVWIRLAKSIRQPFEAHECSATYQTCAEQLGLEFALRVQRHFEPGTTWLHDIIPKIHVFNVTAFLHSLYHTYETTRSKRTVAVIFHEEPQMWSHMHVYHLCRYTNSHCRCTWFKKALHESAAVDNLKTDADDTQRHGRIIKRRTGARKLYSEQLNKSYFARWLQYFHQKRRHIVYFEIAKVSYVGQIHRCKNLRQLQRTQERSGSTQTMEACIDESKDLFREPDQSPTESGDDEVPQTSTKIARGKRQTDAWSRNGTSGKVKKRMEDFSFLLRHFEKYLVVPINNTCDIVEWYSNEETASYDKSDREYSRIVNHMQKMFARMNFHQICDYVAKIENPRYFARDDNFYLTTEQSIDVLDDFLDFQYGNKKIAFVKRLYDICEKQLPKKNSMFVLGAPCSGKTWFFDCVSAFYVSIGHVGNFNKNNAFPLNDCCNKRILIWNEPNIEPSAYDTVKMLAGGDPCPANVKYQSGSTVTRTPLIFTSNAQIFKIHDPVWSSRIFFEKWETCEPLKHVKKYPHPSGYAGLIAKYIIQ